MRTVYKHCIICLIPFIFLTTGCSTAAKTNATSSPIEKNPLQIPISFRTDGFSHYYGMTPPITRHTLESHCIAPLKDSGVQILEWGLGPGSVFCYDTKVGEMFGADITPEHWAMLRDGDRRVYENLKSLKDASVDPLTTAVEYGHSIGLKVFARLEMQHEYGPVGSWQWIEFVGRLNKEHPEYRIPGKTRLDFKHQAVRDFKLAILREAAEKGFDGVSADFCVYPVYFEEPDKYRPVMTQFMRDLRRMLDDVGAKQHRRLELMIRVNAQDSDQRGLDWKTCMSEGLIDYIVPSRGSAVSDYFNISVDEFVAWRDQIHSRCKVFGCLWLGLGLVNTDPKPDGTKSYSKPKTTEMFYSQALLNHRAHADGLQLAMSSVQSWQPFMADLGDLDKIEFADKHYMVDIGPWLPIVFKGRDPFDHQPKEIKLNVADDTAKAIRAGYNVQTNLILYCRSLQPWETILIRINNHDPIEINPNTLGSQNKDNAFSSAEIQAARETKKSQGDSLFSDPDWWRRGQKTIPIPPTDLILGQNTLRFEHKNVNSLREFHDDLEILWVDLTIKYSPAGK